VGFHIPGHIVQVDELISVPETETVLDTGKAIAIGTPGNLSTLHWEPVVPPPPEDGWNIPCTVECCEPAFLTCNNNLLSMDNSFIDTLDLVDSITDSAIGPIRAPSPLSRGRLRPNVAVLQFLNVNDHCTTCILRLLVVSQGLGP
jgi:hypothetical protein